MWELDGEESWAPKNWCFWTVVLEKTLESSLDCKEIQLVHPKGDQSWVFIGGTDVEAETLMLRPPHARSWLIGKDPDAGLGAGGEGDDGGWDGWMASPTGWTWVWVKSGSWWWTGRPGVLWLMGSQRVGHDWATELNWTLVRARQKSSYLSNSFLQIEVLPNPWTHPKRQAAPRTQDSNTKVWSSYLPTAIRLSTQCTSAAFLTFSV